MAAELRPKEAGTRGVRRIFRREVGKAIAALRQGGQPLADEVVHDARKRLKKARAALRLLREALGSRLYDRANACCRDAARPLTEVRDAKVLRETLDELAERGAGAVDAAALDEVRRALRQDQRQVRHVLEERDLGPVEESLEALREWAKDWPVGRRGWSVLGAGLKRVYRSGRDSFTEARQGPSLANLHEWRKQVKYLWHQLQVLRPMRPAVMEELARQAHDLADSLGDDHDLAVLRARLQEKPGRFPEQPVAALVGLIDRRRGELQEQALALGRRLYQERPKQFAGRLKGYWHAWRRDRSRALRCAAAASTP
jgi:CHAD domain-containing protein